MATNVRLCVRPIVRLLLPVYFVVQCYPTISSGGTRIDSSTVFRLSFLSISFSEGLDFAEISRKLLCAVFQLTLMCTFQCTVRFLLMYLNEQLWNFLLFLLMSLLMYRKNLRYFICVFCASVMCALRPRVLRLPGCCQMLLQVQFPLFFFFPSFLLCFPPIWCGGSGV